MAAPAPTPSPAIPLAAERQAVHRSYLMPAVLAITDFYALTSGVAAGFAVWSLINPRIPPIHAGLIVLPLGCLAEFALSGQYPGIGISAVEHLRRSWRGISLVYLLLTAAMFFTRDALAESRGAFAVAWLASLALVPLGRAAAGALFHARSWWGVPVVILGAGDSARTVIRNLRANRVLGYRPVACFDDHFAPGALCEGIPVLGALVAAGAAANASGIRHAIIADPGMATPHMLWHVRRWRQVFPRMLLLLPNATQYATLSSEPRDLGGILALEMRHNLLNPWNQVIKRAADLILASLALLCAAPLLAICALWIRKVSPGSPFYTQPREGKGGRGFQLLKLRTMYPDAERLLEHRLAADPEARRHWDRFCKLKDDPRILPGIGHFLRKTSLDELPQLWNILKGEMSLVGPRPFPEYHNSRFDPEFRAVRTQVTPGLTGLWQISARSDGDLDVQQSLDGYYIRNWSLWLDLYILVRTFRAVLARDGAY